MGRPTVLARSAMLSVAAIFSSIWAKRRAASRFESARESVRLALAAIEALVFAPIIALRSGKTLRELTLARDQLDRLAHFDSLTGLLKGWRP